MIKNFVSLMGILLLLMSCSSKTIDYNKLSSFDENNNLRAVIEIPSGTNDKVEYRAERNSFEIDSLNGHPRVIEFLPYPVNYGFIPSTNTSKESKADPLDILVYGKPFKTGQIVSVKPIGILEMLDEGEEDDKVLCIPIKKKYQIIDIKDFQDLSKNYPTLRNMISDWFLNYDKNADIQILGWFDESKALRIVDSLQS